MSNEIDINENDQLLQYPKVLQTLLRDHSRFDHLREAEVFTPSWICNAQHNPYLKGMEDFYKPIFDAIANKRVIEIVYHPFGRDARSVVVSPCHLKQVEVLAPESLRQVMRENVEALYNMYK